MFKHFLSILIVAFTLTACGGGSSDSGAMTDTTLPGTNVPASFVGVYRGDLTVTAEALNLSETDTFPITITVNNDGTIRFDGDDPDETFTVGLQNDGRFAGNLPIDVDDCSGSLGVTGQVDGVTASGDVSGEGRCNVSGVTISVTLVGVFTANR